MMVGESRVHDDAPVRALEPRELPRRRLTSRIGLLHVVAMASGVIAFALILSWMRAQEQVVEVAVATETIRSGNLVSRHLIEFVEVPAGGDLTAALLSPDEVTRLDGAVATRQITAGEPVLDSDLRGVEVPAGLRAMSLPVDPARAAGGELTVGDRVDVIGFAGPVARYVATDLEVIDVPGTQAGTFGASATFAVTVAVDDIQALAVATALHADDLHLLRSTGSPGVTVERLEPVGEELPTGDVPEGEEVDE